MRVAETLGKSIEETMQLSVLELQMWLAWFGLQQDAQKETMKRGNANNRNPRIR
jgi:hypothetical protein